MGLTLRCRRYIFLGSCLHLELLHGLLGLGNVAPIVVAAHLDSLLTFFFGKDTGFHGKSAFSFRNHSFSRIPNQIQVKVRKSLQILTVFIFYLAEWRFFSRLCVIPRAREPMWSRLMPARTAFGWNIPLLPGEKTIQFPPLFRGRGPTGFARFWIVFLKKHMKSVHRLPVRQRMRTGKQIMAELREKRGEITSVDQTYIVFSRM